jgi:hypothetical protein
MHFDTTEGIYHWNSKGKVKGRKERIKEEKGEDLLIK